MSNLSRVIPWMLILRFEHSTLWIRIEQHNHSTMAASAIFNAILQTFNHEDIRSHLKRCWNVILLKYDAKELRSRSFLRFCCCHIMNTFARSLSAANVAKGIRKRVTHIFTLFINRANLKCYSNFSNVFYICLVTRKLLMLRRFFRCF